jgi:ATP-dependent protease ClpP protease subunit
MKKTIIATLLLVPALTFSAPVASPVTPRTVPFELSPAQIAQVINNPVPTTTPASTGITLDTPQTVEGTNMSTSWDFLISQVRSTTGDVTIKIAGYGGYMVDAQIISNVLIDAIHQNRKVNMDVVGLAASADALIACYSTHVTLRPGSVLLFHAVATEGSMFFGMVHYRNLPGDILTDSIQENMLQQCVSRQILTQKDLEVIKRGDDVLIINQAGTIMKYYAKDNEGYQTILPQVLYLIAVLCSLLVLIGVTKRI